MGQWAGYTIRHRTFTKAEARKKVSDGSNDAMGCARNRFTCPKTLSIVGLKTRKYPFFTIIHSQSSPWSNIYTLG